MISIITCSIKPDICQKMLDSVSKTIGTEYETIVFDNRDKKYGICKAYNEAAKTANGDYLCFVHEDIEITTNNWGKNLIEFVSKTENCGIVGLAGGKVIPRNFQQWGTGTNARYNYHDPNNRKLEKKYDHSNLTHFYYNPENEKYSKVVTLDGLFLFTSTNIWKENPFNENNFTDFHFYDADFSLAIAQKYSNYVYFGMDVYHFSGGNVEKTFCENMYLFQKKWRNKLPYCLPGYKISFRQELRNASSVFSLYRQNGLSKIKCFTRIYKINGILFSMLFLAKKVKNFLSKYIRERVKEFSSIKKQFQNKIGLEIGGPSGAFMNRGYMPIYKIMKSLDGVNFSSSTVWTGDIKESKGFIVNGKNTGKMYIADATDLGQIENGIYDFVLSCNNIEHIANPMKAMEQWILKLKHNGILVIIAPRKEANFDHKREIVKFAHLLEDYNNGIDEYDLTHLDEILSLHDLAMDPPAGTLEEFKERSMRNYENRCLHHHVFDLDVLEQMCNYFKLAPILKLAKERDYIIVAKKE